MRSGKIRCVTPLSVRNTDPVEPKLFEPPLHNLIDALDFDLFSHQARPPLPGRFELVQIAIR